MRIESITARAFGPLKSASLTLAPGLTIIHGLNESGKSSWHAAIFAGLCGMRRGKGVRGPDREFSRRHHPWSGEEWRVDLLLKLDTGRRVELRQNLADLTDCHASDADFGGDISGEILHDNTPDATKWLGLNREIFSDVACVRQAEILELTNTEVASGLQEQLQKAAASTGRDATAAQAIERLEEYQKEHVGGERANSTKPLQRAKNRFEAAQRAHQNAHVGHREWLSLEAQAQQLGTDAAVKQRRYQMLVAAEARREAAAWAARLRRAREIGAKFPTPPTLTDQVSVAEEVASALDQWEHKGEISLPQGESAAAIRATIEALPPVPDGDLQPSPDIVRLKTEFERAREAARFHADQRPVDPGVLQTRLTPDAIRELAREIESVIPCIDPSVESTYQRAREQSERANAPQSKVFVASAAIGVLASIIGLWWFGYAGSAVAVGLGALFVLAVFAFRKRSVPPGSTEMLDAIEAQRHQQRSAIESVRARKEAAYARTRSEGLPGTAQELNALADAIVLAGERQQRLDSWISQRESVATALQKARLALMSELEGRGVAETSDPESAFDQYVEACRVRAQQAMRAQTKPGLLVQLQTREAAEAAATETARRHVEVAERILSLDARLEGTASSPEAAVTNLRAWRKQQAELITKYESDRSEYAELSAILGDRSLADIEVIAEQAYSRAQTLSEHVRAAYGDALETDTQLDLDTVQQEAVTATKTAAAADGTVGERARSLASVAEAEEELERAQNELDRCRRLQSTLSEALRFLLDAEEKVNRDLAPKLAAELREWLPAVTTGRYTDARVDPGDLGVQVRDVDQNWRDVWSLSHGTLEQVYLLLRVVLAKWLVTTGESCPLILDDVLVHCDRVRKLAILDTLKALSAHRQVILFTQEDEVLRWAEGLAPGQLIRLADPIGAK